MDADVDENVDSDLEVDKNKSLRNKKGVMVKKCSLN